MIVVAQGGYRLNQRLPGYFLALFVPSAALVLGGAAFAYRYQAASELRSVSTRESIDAERGVHALLTNLEAYSNDLGYLLELPETAATANEPSDANLEKPVIAAMNGFAVGVGLSLALQCQLRVMAEDAWIGDTHTKVGRLGSAHNLYESLPRATAAYLTLCNGRLTAAECLQQGIVNRVVPKARLIQAAEELAAMVCEGSPRAIQAAVRLYRLSAAFPAALTAYARHLDQETAESEDGAEGPRAFRERRKPRWTGR